MYTKETFDFIKSKVNQDELDYVSFILGVPKNAVLGAIAEERDAVHRSAFDTGKDSAASWWASNWTGLRTLWGNPNDTIQKDLDRAKEFKGDPGLLDKLWNPALIDFGEGNIRLSTAAELLEKYNRDYPTSDPLGLKKYNTDPYRLRADIENAENTSATVKFWALKIKEAQDYMERHADPDIWASRSPDFKDAVYITYGNLNPKDIDARRTASGLPYDPKPGPGDAGGDVHLENADGLSATYRPRGGVMGPPPDVFSARRAGVMGPETNLFGSEPYGGAVGFDHTLGSSGRLVPARRGAVDSESRHASTAFGVQPTNYARADSRPTKPMDLHQAFDYAWDQLQQKREARAAAEQPVRAAAAGYGSAHGDAAEGPDRYRDDAGAGASGALPYASTGHRPGDPIYDGSRPPRNVFELARFLPPEWQLPNRPDGYYLTLA